MKGVLFSISTLLVFITVLSLVLAFSLHRTKTNEEISKDLSSDRVYYEYESIEYGFKQIFFHESGVNFTKNGNSVTIMEYLPENNANWIADVEMFKMFAGNYSQDTINTGLSGVENQLMLNITPGILFNHTNYGSRNLDFRPTSSSLVPGKFVGYDIRIDLLGLDTGGECDSNLQTNSTPQNYLLVCLFVKGTPESCNFGCNYIDPTQTSTASTSAGDSGQVTFRFDTSGHYRFTSNVNVLSNTTLLLNNITERVKITYPPNIILTNFTEFNVRKNSTVHIM